MRRHTMPRSRPTAGTSPSPLDAANLSTEEDLLDQTDVFVRDLQAGTTTLASRAFGASGEDGDNTSFSPSISADGNVVAFASTANNLSPQVNDALVHVFARDLRSGATHLVSSRGVFPIIGANGSSDGPSLSADGRLVAFTSGASNLPRASTS